MKTISIIVPVYNVAEYLDKCISSIYSQLTDDVEVILVDDGSTDGISPDLCDTWSKRDERISVIHKENGGLSDARNAGLKQAAGKYVFFVDSDDYIEPNTLEILKYYIKFNDEMIVFNYRMVDENGQELSCSHFHPGITDINLRNNKYYYWLKWILNTNFEEPETMAMSWFRRMRMQSKLLSYAAHQNNDVLYPLRVLHGYIHERLVR